MMASVFIILISGLAFAAGFFKESTVTEIEEKKGIIAEEEVDIDRIEAKINDILMFDFMRIDKARSTLQEAKVCAKELNITFDNLTAEEILVYEEEVKENLRLSEFFMRDTNCFYLIRHFDTDGKLTDYNFTTEKDDGYDFSISRAEFLELNDTIGLYRFKPRIAVLNNLDLRAIYWDSVIPEEPEYYLDLSKIENWAELYRNELSEKQISIASISAEIADLESKASYYNYGVTLITVASILASAMVAKLSSNESDLEFADFKEKLFTEHEIKDDSEKPKKNKIALPMVIFALVISICGLVIPLILALI